MKMLPQPMQEQPMPNELNPSGQLPDQMLPDLSIQQPEGESFGEIPGTLEGQQAILPDQVKAQAVLEKWVGNDPLRMLVDGPGLDLDEIYQALNEWPLEEVSLSERSEFLSDLVSQDLSGKPVLAPNWWEGKPEEFGQKLRQEVSYLLRPEKDLNPASVQLLILQTLLSMWQEQLQI
jgi:hypothetical protein